MSFDAFGRTRVSDPTTLFDSQLQYNLQPLLWETIGDGTAAHNADASACQLSVTAGQTVGRQTRQYIRYQPGKSQLILITGTLGAAAAGVTKRIGYFDDANGVFFELAEDGTQYWVLRSSSSGTMVETRIASGVWNLSGVRGQDFEKSQIWVIDLEWLGVGQVRCGFVWEGEFRYVHAFRNENNVTLPYMTTANLPLRYEMVSTTGAADDMYQICAAVMSEGGFSEELGIPHSVGSGTAGVSVTSRQPVLTIQPALTFNSVTNRAAIVPEEVSVMVTGNPAYYEIVYGGTVTGGSAVTVGTNSVVDYNAGGTAISGGEVIASGYLAAGGPTASARASGANRLASKLPLSLNAAGSAPTTLSVVVTGIGGAAVSYAALTWRELY